MVSFYMQQLHLPHVALSPWGQEGRLIPSTSWAGRKKDKLSESRIS